MIKTLYLDFDCTIVNSIKRIVEMYDQDYRNYPGYKSVDWSEINTWGFEELKLLDGKDVEKYFAAARFFDGLDYIDYAEDCIDRLSSFFRIVVVSMGTLANLAGKEKWLWENIPQAEFVGIDSSIYKDKSHIDMSDGILIDDSLSNLDTSNAQEKIIFGDLYPWNDFNNNHLRCFNWIEVERFLMKHYINRI